MKRFQIQVFGKPGCPKCTTLKGRIDRMLAKKEWSDFTRVEHDLHTEQGLVEFCLLECINPQRIPAFVVGRYDETASKYVPLMNPDPDQPDPVCGNAKLYTYLGLQTDYSGDGILKPKMITAVLRQAQQMEKNACVPA